MPDRIEASNGTLAEISGFESTQDDSGSDFRSRFCGLQVCVYTNAPPALGLRKSIGIECDLLETNWAHATATESLDSLTRNAQSISNQVLRRFESGTEIVLVHLDAMLIPGLAAGGDSSLLCLQLLDRIAERAWGSGDGDILQCVVVGGRHHHDGRANLWGLADTPATNGHAEGWDQGGDARLARLRPAQSCDMHDGQPIAPPAGGGAWREQRVMYGMLHRQGTRCDSVAAFAPAQVLARGERRARARARERTHALARTHTRRSRVLIDGYSPTHPLIYAFPLPLLLRTHAPVPPHPSRARG
jgi:hypothetical protein